MDIPKTIKSILEDIKTEGYEAYLVGGCVRDFLLGITPYDFDIATNASPEEIKSIFYADKIIPTGIAHGTLTVIREDFFVEITTYRIEGEYLDKRRPSSVRFTNSIHQDLSRRDFTINAIAYFPLEGFIDPFNGIKDLKAGVIRAVGNPKERFLEDPLRIIRGLRFASQKGFLIEKHTSEEMNNLRTELLNVTIERIVIEFKGMLCGEYIKKILLNYREIIAIIIPEIKDTFDFPQRNPHHIYDVYTHTVEVVSALPPNFVLRFAGLLHDIAKPKVFSLDSSGIGHFYGHVSKGTKIAEDTCKRLKLDLKTTKTVVNLVKAHDMQISHNEKSIKRIMNKFTPEFFPLLIQLKKADNLAKHPHHKNRVDRFDDLLKIYNKILEENMCFNLSHLAINGNDLIQIGFPQGPIIGKVLNSCLEAVISEKISNNREELLNYAIINHRKL